MESLYSNRHKRYGDKVGASVEKVQGKKKSVKGLRKKAFSTCIGSYIQFSSTNTHTHEPNKMMVVQKVF